MKRKTNYVFDADGKREHVGPKYPKLGESVAKHRYGTGKLMSWLLDDRRAYGEAVGAAIRALQRSELNSAGRRMPLVHRESIGYKRRDAMRARLLACPDAVRRARPPHVWQEMYDEAMAEKRERALDVEYGPRLQNPA